MKFSKESGGLYTRYADDITISFPTEARCRKCVNVDHEINPDFEKLVIEEGFRLNTSKTRLLLKRNRQMVTGIIINEKSNVKRSYITDLRNIIYVLNKFGESAAREAYSRKYGAKKVNIKKYIEGKLIHLRRVKGGSDPVYIKLATEYTKFNPDFLASEKQSPLTVKLQCKILAEGKTDYNHIANALKYFNTIGKFQNLELDLSIPSNIEGYTDLDNYINKSETLKFGTVHIAIFDADATAINKKYHERYHRISDTLYVFRLPRPDFLPIGENFCIEMLYKEVDLVKYDASGRRLFFVAEFNKSDFSHKSDPYIICNQISWDKLVIDGKVFKIVNDKRISIGLSKNDFAAHIANMTSTTSPPDLSAFVEVFNIIEEICLDYKSRQTDTGMH